MAYNQKDNWLLMLIDLEEDSKDPFLCEA